MQKHHGVDIAELKNSTTQLTTAVEDVATLVDLENRAEAVSNVENLLDQQSQIDKLKGQLDGLTTALDYSGALLSEQDAVVLLDFEDGSFMLVMMTLMMMMMMMMI